MPRRPPVSHTLTFLMQVVTENNFQFDLVDANVIMKLTKN